jgi:hypothetical protein
VLARREMIKLIGFAFFVCIAGTALAIDREFGHPLFRLVICNAFGRSLSRLPAPGFFLQIERNQIGRLNFINPRPIVITRNTSVMSRGTGRIQQSNK